MEITKRKGEGCKEIELSVFYKRTKGNNRKEIVKGKK